MTPTPSNRQLKVVRAADITAPEEPTPAWLVEHLWGSGAVGVIGGAPKACKSWLALELAVAVASGRPCLGRFPVPDPGPVLVYAAEDAPLHVRQRIEHLCQARGAPLPLPRARPHPRARLAHRPPRNRSSASGPPSPGTAPASSSLTPTSSCRGPTKTTPPKWPPSSPPSARSPGRSPSPSSSSTTPENPPAVPAARPCAAAPTSTPGGTQPLPPAPSRRSHPHHRTPRRPRTAAPRPDPRPRPPASRHP
jgi:hypothetical protein